VPGGADGPRYDEEGLQLQALEALMCSRIDASYSVYY
jgi:hypothetical protein